jgi:hypothetical protein
MTVNHYLVQFHEAVSFTRVQPAQLARFTMTQLRHREYPLKMLVLGNRQHHKDLEAGEPERSNQDEANPRSC